jgi:electron transfer flavoprotein alpha/beta subunit
VEILLRQMAMGAKKGVLLSVAAFDGLNNSGIAGLLSAFVRKLF